MYEFYLNDNKYAVVNAWEELSQDQFIYLADLLWRYQQGEIDAGEVRIQFFLYVSGLKPRRIRRAEREQLYCENVFRICQHMDFFFKWKYKNQKAFEAFPPELQERLLHTDPEDMEESANIRAARKLKRHLEIDACFAKNLIPDLKGNVRVQAYRFILTDQFLDTSLTAAQYVDAVTVFDNWSKKPTAESLNLLVAILYLAGKYTSEQAYKNVEIIARYPEKVKRAILLNFMALHLFLSQQTQYAILFTGTGTDSKGKINLGFHESLYSLEKVGYSNVEDMDLVKFLQVMVKELKDAVQTMHANEMKIEEIAKKVKLPIRDVRKLT